MSQSVTRKVAYNTGVQIAGKILISLIAAVSVGILTRYLGPTGYGKFTTALVFLSVFSILADLGLFTVVVKKISEKPADTKRVVGNAMSLRLVLSVSIMLLAIGVGWLLPYTPDVKYGIMIASTSLVFGLLNSSLITVFQARLRMDYSVIADLVGRAASLAAVIAVASLGLGYYAVVATATIGSLGTFLVSWFLVRRLVKVRFLGDYAMWKSLLVQSLPIGITIALSFIYFRLDTFLLSLFRSSAEVGFYGAAFKVIEIILTVPGFFVNSVFPVLTQYVASGDDRTKGLVQQSFDVLMVLGFPLAAGTVLLGGPVVRVVAGADFGEAAIAMQLLGPAVAFSFLNLLLGNMIVAKGRFKAMMYISGGSLLFNIAINVATIPAYGFRAAAINTVISEAMVFGAAYLLARRYFGFGPNFRAAPRILLAVGIMGVVIVALQGVSPVLAFFAGSAAYLASVYVWNGPGKLLATAVLTKGARP